MASDSNAQPDPEGKKKSRLEWIGLFLPALVTLTVAWITFQQQLRLSDSNSELQKTIATNKNTLEARTNDQETRLKQLLHEQDSKQAKAFKVRDDLLARALKQSDIAMQGSLKERDIDLKMVELALDILKRDSTQDTEALKAWAADVINFHSRGVKLSADARRQLADSNYTSMRGPRLLSSNAIHLQIDGKNSEMGCVQSYKIIQKGRNKWFTFRFKYSLNKEEPERTLFAVLREPGKVAITLDGIDMLNCKIDDYSESRLPKNYSGPVYDDFDVAFRFADQNGTERRFWFMGVAPIDRDSQ